MSAYFQYFTCHGSCVIVLLILYCTYSNIPRARCMPYCAYNLIFHVAYHTYSNTALHVLFCAHSNIAHAPRPRACDLLKHTLMVEAHPETVLSMLVARTKDAVRRLDNKNYRAARKIFMLNNHNGVSLCIE